MSYIKATAVLPERLLNEIQKYVEGEILYIPKKETSHLEWGSRSGARREIDCRNQRIRKSFKDGKKVEQLSKEYYLSTDTIKKIVYKKSRKSF